MLRRLVIGGALLLTAAGAFNAEPAAAVTVGESLSGIHLKAFEGEALGGAAFEGKITIVNFWATWCAACKVELLEMEEQLQARLADKNFQIAFVALDKEPAKAADWFKKNLKDPERMLKSLYLDETFELADKLGIDSFPMTIIIGKDGKVAHVQKGFKEGQGSTEKLVKLSEDLLRQAAH